VKSSEKIFFWAEFALDVERLVLFCHKHTIDISNYMVIALQPEVSVFCKKSGILHCNTLSFFDTNSHRRALQKSHGLTSLISEHLFEKSHDPTHRVCVDTFVFYARFYINHFLWTLEVLRGLKEKYSAFEICVFLDCEQDKGSCSEHEPYLTERDRSSVSLAVKFCERNNLKIAILEDNLSAVQKDKEGRSPMRESFLTNFFKKLYLRQFSKISGKRTVFIPFPHYNLDRLCQDIQIRFADVLCVSGSMRSRTWAGYMKLYLMLLMRSFYRQENQEGLIRVPFSIFRNCDNRTDQMEWKQLKHHYGLFARKYQEEFIFENCSFWDEFNNKVEKDMLASLTALLCAFKYQKNFLAKLKPNLMISCVSWGENQSLAEAAQALGIPAIVVPQKMLVAPTDTSAQIEELYIGRAQVTESYRNVASQSPFVTEYLKWSGYQGCIHETGNLILSRITPEKKQERRIAFFEKIGAEKKIIVWAPSMKTRRSRRFFMLETWEELLVSMEDVFEIVSRMGDVHLLFRIHPGSKLTADDFMTLLPFPENVSVSGGGSFEDVLAIADVLLSYSSTCIQEALVNSIPVILYDRWKRYNHLCAYRINGTLPQKESPAHYIDSKDHLESGLKWILTRQNDWMSREELFDDYVFNKKSVNRFYDFVKKCLS
jgi:hypothetical protein